MNFFKCWACFGSGIVTANSDCLVCKGTGSLPPAPPLAPPPAAPAPAPAKTRWDLVPWPALSLVADVMAFGLTKYPTADDWKKVPLDRHKQALLRHVISYMSGEKIDSESGKPHLAHAGCRVLFILWLEANAK